MKNWVLVGSIGKPYGTKGWVKINSYTEPIYNIIQYHPWSLTLPSNKSGFAVKVLDYRLTNQRLIVQLENYETPEGVRLLTNHKIYVERKNFPTLAKGEYYWVDLEGISVYNCKDVKLGVVKTVFSTGSNDILLVENGERHLIPFLNHTIKTINLARNIIVVDWDPT